MGRTPYWDAVVIEAWIEKRKHTRRRRRGVPLEPPGPGEKVESLPPCWDSLAGPRANRKNGSAPVMFSHATTGAPTEKERSTDVAYTDAGVLAQERQDAEIEAAACRRGASPRRGCDAPPRRANRWAGVMDVQRGSQ